MLQLILKERFFANICLTKKCDLELFDNQFSNLKVVISKRQTTFQNAINDNDNFIIILLNVL